MNSRSDMSWEEQPLTGGNSADVSINSAPIIVNDSHNSSSNVDVESRGGSLLSYAPMAEAPFVDDLVRTPGPRGRWEWIPESSSEASSVGGGTVMTVPGGEQRVASPLGRSEEKLLAVAMAELLGTAFLVFFVCINAVLMTKAGAPTASADLTAAWSGGLAIMCLVYSLGPVSGGHFNPVVSLTALVFYKMRLRNFFVYISMQFLGGIIGAAFVGAIIPDPWSEANGYLGAVNISPMYSSWNAFFCEFATSFFLIFVILNVAWQPHPKVYNSGVAMTGIYVGMVIGFCVTLLTVSTAPLSGACLNPARYFGPALLSVQWNAPHIYLIADPLGGLLAGFLHSLLFSYNRQKQVDLGC